MTRNEMIRLWRKLMRYGDTEAAKEIEFDFFSVWGESIFDYV